MDHASSGTSHELSRRNSNSAAGRQSGPQLPRRVSEDKRSHWAREEYDANDPNVWSGPLSVFRSLREDARAFRSVCIPAPVVIESLANIATVRLGRATETLDEGVIRAPASIVYS
jgi:hypothetical protein